MCAADVPATTRLPPEPDMKLGPSRPQSSIRSCSGRMLLRNGELEKDDVAVFGVCEELVDSDDGIVAVVETDKGSVPWLVAGVL
ncbi:hypothetical protein Vau01_042530 [Virgisporangium aurantiacum]|uniref:Uncharacterized protein n=1 Tax=Virgisporangium aurantiacum TaxID=175570 RepID=A0A8J3Z5B1_9ACTN|nr:hypothetical protein Vau01_042530 [Virgisporangium aurantiacum]